MTLREKQSVFMKALGELIRFAHDQGYELTGGDLFAKSGHKEGSFHYKRLAIDLNFFRDGNWLTSTEDHAPLGHYWESLGGTWGGRFKTPDGNHYSFGE
jgi:hypothetical protein